MELRILSKEEKDQRLKKLENYLKPRIKEYDLCTIDLYFYPHNTPYFYKKNAKCVDRIAVDGFNIHVFGSPSFFNELGLQIQKQIEKAIEVENIHKIPNFTMRITPFKNHFDCDGMSYFHEMHNNICYSYTQCMVDYESKYLDNIMYFSTNFWIRFYSLKTPNMPVDTNGDFSYKNIRFEICNITPKSFPQIADWPKEVLEKYNQFNFPGMKERIYYLYDYCLYINPGQWKEVLKEKINYILEKNRKAEERAKRKAEKEKKKIPVEYPAEIIYWPDIIYHLTMNGDVTEDTVDEITDVISEYFESLKGEKPEFFSVDKVNENICDITVDFGMSPVKTLKGVVKAIEKAGINIEKIVVEG